MVAGPAQARKAATAQRPVRFRASISRGSASFRNRYEGDGVPRSGKEAMAIESHEQETAGA
jgi:hypothetical protein